MTSPGEMMVNPLNDDDFLSELHSRLVVIETEVDQMTLSAEKEADAIRVRLIIGKLFNLERLLKDKRVYLVSTLKDIPSHYRDGRALSERQKMVLASVKELEKHQSVNAYIVGRNVDLPMSTTYRILKKLVSYGVVSLKDGYYTSEDGNRD